MTLELIKGKFDEIADINDCTINIIASPFYGTFKKIKNKIIESEHRVIGESKQYLEVEAIYTLIIER